MNNNIYLLISFILGVITTSFGIHFERRKWKKICFNLIDSFNEHRKNESICFPMPVCLFCENKRPSDMISVVMYINSLHSKTIAIKHCKDNQACASRASTLVEWDGEKIEKYIKAV
jgi:hypothetical protein